MSELPLTIHLTVSEGTLVLVTLRPAVRTLPIDDITAELSRVLASVREHCHALAVLLIAQPGTFVLRHHAILVPLTRVELQPMTMSHHFKLFDTLLLLKRLDLGLVDWSGGFDHLAI